MILLFIFIKQNKANQVNYRCGIELSRFYCMLNINRNSLIPALSKTNINWQYHLKDINYIKCKLWILHADVHHHYCYTTKFIYGLNLLTLVRTKSGNFLSTMLGKSSSLRLKHFWARIRSKKWDVIRSGDFYDPSKYQLAFHYKNSFASGFLKREILSLKPRHLWTRIKSRNVRRVLFKRLPQS